MVFLKEFLFIIFLVHFNVAINLNIFSFKRAPVKNVSKSDIFIQPTATLTTFIKITQPSQIVDPFPIVYNEKHEFENEPEGVDASPESEAESNSTVSVPGQEIDETRNSSSYSVSEKNDKFNSFVAKFTSTPYLPSIPKITLPKLPSLPKKKTITFTKTLVSKFTKHEVVYPSCIKVEDVKSVCDGSLITIQPTPTIYSQNTRPTSTNLPDVKDVSYDVVEPPENRRRRATNDTSESIKDSKKQNFRYDVIEPSELDYDFEVVDTQQATPTSEKLLKGYSKPSNFIESLLISEPKIQFVTEFLSVTSVLRITDHAATVTLIAHNCLPANVNLKSCPKPPQPPIIPAVPVLPILHSKNVTKPKNKNKMKENDRKVFSTSPQPEKISTPMYKPEKAYDIMDELNRYILMNANRLIDSTGYEYIDLNADSTIIEPAYLPYFRRARSMKVN